MAQPTPQFATVAEPNCVALGYFKNTFIGTQNTYMYIKAYSLKSTELYCIIFKVRVGKSVAMKRVK